MIRRIKAMFEHAGMARHAPTKSQISLVAMIGVILLTVGTALAQDTGTSSVDIRERILTLADTRPVAQIILFALIVLGIYTGGLFLLSMRQRYAITWRATLRLAGWVIPLIAIALVVVLVLGNDKDAQFGPHVTVPFIQLIIPIAAAIHTALIFSPEDEPLEMLLALPRPITWLVFERVLVIILIYTGIGVMGMGFMAVQGKLPNAGALLVAWVPSMLFLVGLSLYLTVRTRVMMMGVVGALVAWFVFMLFNPYLMPGTPQPFPSNYIQPLLWMINIFVQPSMFPEIEYYTLNRLILIGLGLFWLWRTAAELNNSESLLLTLQDRQMRRRNTSAVEEPKSKRSLKLNPAPVAIHVLRQITAMWLYETKLHWRRRPLKVVFLTLLITTVISNLIMQTGLPSASMDVTGLSGAVLEQALMLKGIFLMTTSMSVLSVVQMLILPVMLADSVVLDESDHMREMLQSTPLPGWAYLVGKIGGAWWASMSAIALSMILICILSLLTVGAYNPIPMIDGWIVLSVPCLLFNGGFALLVGTTQPTRRRAVFIVMGAFLISVMVSARDTSGLLAALNPYNTSLLMTLFSEIASEPGAYTPIFSQSGVADFFIGRGVVFVITAIIVGLWWSWRWSGFSLWPKSAAVPAQTPVQQGS